MLEDVGASPTSVLSPKASSSSMVPFSPLSRQPRLIRMGTRVELLQHDGLESELGCEVWTFDEDAYTVGLTALATKTWKHSSMELCFVLITPIVQMAFCYKLVAILTTLERPEREVSVIVQSVCCLLALVQLANEAVEGLHKVIFSMRGCSGLYAEMCPASMSVGIALGFCQTLIGIFTFALCVKLTWLSKTELDALMNFIALSFIADIDNILIRSRLVQPYISLNPVVKVKRACQDWCRKGTSKTYTVRMCAVTNAVILLMTIGTVGVTVEKLKIAGHKHYILWHYLCWIPYFLLTWFGTALAMWQGSQRLGACNTALIISKSMYALFAVHYIINRWTHNQGLYGTYWALVNPLWLGIMFGVNLSFIPASFAVTLEPFDQFYVLPREVLLVFCVTSLASHDMDEWMRSDTMVVSA
mmetsp:Transcript_4980/g.12835  ORF Transcript_4980/g.12835 Transcript_4980/m.12835 type:complete len:416 (-) Transcript_4980:38-1285(-)